MSRNSLEHSRLRAQTHRTLGAQFLREIREEVELVRLPRLRVPHNAKPPLEVKVCPAERSDLALPEACRECEAVDEAPRPCRSEERRLFGERERAPFAPPVERLLAALGHASKPSEVSSAVIGGPRREGEDVLPLRVRRSRRAPLLDPLVHHPLDQVRVEFAKHRLTVEDRFREAKEGTEDRAPHPHRSRRARLLALECLEVLGDVFAQGSR